MGHVNSTLGGDEQGDFSPATPPDVSMRRRAYLHRLGIQRDGKFAGFYSTTPQATVEAPDRLETSWSVPSRKGSLICRCPVPSSCQTWGPSSSQAEGPSSTQTWGERSCIETSSNERERDDPFEMNMLNLRAQDDFRVSFLSKLSYHNVWVPAAQRPPQHQTVVIFDWDDTLLCTTNLNFRRDEDMSSGLARNLRGIEANAKKLLQQAMMVGSTFIITNAAPGWVEYTCRKYLPGLVETLRHIRVISARGKYEALCPNAPGEWKAQAFLEVQRQLDSQIITNLLSFGDSNFEMDAVHVMGKEFAHAIVKTIKFKERPTAEELNKELELTVQKFDKISLNASNLKISLERKDPSKSKPREAGPSTSSLGEGCTPPVLRAAEGGGCCCAAADAVVPTAVPSEDQTMAQGAAGNRRQHKSQRSSRTVQSTRECSGGASAAAAPDSPDEASASRESTPPCADLARPDPGHVCSRGSAAHRSEHTPPPPSFGPPSSQSPFGPPQRGETAPPSSSHVSAALGRQEALAPAGKA